MQLAQRKEMQNPITQNKDYEEVKKFVESIKEEAYYTITNNSMFEEVFEGNISSRLCDNVYIKHIDGDFYYVILTFEERTYGIKNAEEFGRDEIDFDIDKTSYTTEYIKDMNVFHKKKLVHAILDDFEDWI